MPQKKVVQAAADGIPKAYYRRKEVAYMLGLSLRSIDLMIADKRLKTERFGAAVLIPAAAVDEVVNIIMNYGMSKGARQGSEALATRANADAASKRDDRKHQNGVPRPGWGG